ncbi:MBL fold metallo-hydrolase [Prevotella sp. E13-27]|uniref:MBL fold metallo-hydrolase n=1 Tax=Prevotella sp. E13-27 TaxID=2938122 RepID=UPI00200A77C0|nr:MBL fold metallo-hydrolase [Prevotella sp. E13-27]MCK8623632.1 MBL fold metallo-hydrolase [Prevotella sp. E13-27]
MLTVDFITNRVFNSRTYILSDEKYDSVWLVDCGDTDRVLEKIGQKSVEGVLLTHAHSDHIYGVEELIKRFPAVKVYTNAAGVEALKSPKLNISHYHSEYPDISIDEPDNVCVLKEGDSLEVLGMPVHVYETPGHAPSCITYIIDNKAFTGDSYIPGVKVFTGFPHANKKQSETSLARILKLSADCQIMPGHS